MTVDPQAERTVETGCGRRTMIAKVLAGGVALASGGALYESTQGRAAEKAKEPAGGSPAPAPGPKPADVAAAQRQHARDLHKESIVIVIHDHNPVATDIEPMQRGGVTAKVFQVGLDVDIGPKFLDTAPLREGWSRRALAQIDEVERLAKAQPGKLLIAKTAADIVRAKREGKLAIMLGVEGAKLLEGKIEMLRMFYDRGLRELQLRWAVPNQIVEQETLTDFGRQVIRECNRLGVIVGLTHIPLTAFHQAIDMIDKPPIVCHGIAARAPERRGDFLGDRQLKALAGAHGVIGLHFYSSYLGNNPKIEHVVEQVDYIANLVGIDTVGLGVDFFPTDGEWGAFQRSQATENVAWAIPDISHLGDVTEALVARNYTDEDIKKVLGGNFLRVCKEVFGK